MPNKKANVSIVEANSLEARTSLGPWSFTSASKKFEVYLHIALLAKKRVQQTALYPPNFIYKYMFLVFTPSSNKNLQTQILC